MKIKIFLRLFLSLIVFFDSIALFAKPILPTLRYECTLTAPSLFFQQGEVYRLDLRHRFPSPRLWAALFKEASTGLYLYGQYVGDQSYVVTEGDLVLSEHFDSLPSLAIHPSGGYAVMFSVLKTFAVMRIGQGEFGDEEIVWMVQSRSRSGSGAVEDFFACIKILDRRG